MSIKVMSAVFDRYPNGGGEMLLALAIADHAHDDGSSVRPSVKTLAKKTRQSERTVQYQLRKMQDCGWLILVRNTSGKPGDTNVYSINPEWMTGAKIDGCKNCTGATDSTDGCNSAHRRVQNDAQTGAIAVAPKPSVKQPSVKQPSKKPSDKAPSRSMHIPASDLVALGVSHQVADDFLTIRKSCKAPLTKTALEGIRNQAEKAGLTLDAALRICAERGWRSFKAEWHQGDRGKKNSHDLSGKNWQEGINPDGSF